MKSYETLELKVLVLDDADVLTESAEFVDSTAGDNGVWFPGNSNGKQEVWKQ